SSDPKGIARTIPLSWRALCCEIQRVSVGCNCGEHSIQCYECYCLQTEVSDSSSGCSHYMLSSLASDEKQYARTDNDIRFQDLYGHLQAIVTSSAVNDSGTFFKPSARDDRYMPFEWYGAISSWQLQNPTDFRQFD